MQFLQRNGAQGTGGPATLTPAAGPHASGGGSRQRQMVRPDQHVPILVLLDDQGERRLD